MAKKKTITFFFPALKAKVATLQHFHRPSKLMQDGKVFITAKHKLCGRKVKVPLLSNGLALFCSKRYLGAVSDLTSMTSHSDVHKELLQKSITSSNSVDYGEHAQKYLDFWPLLCCNGYIDTMDFLRAVHPQHKPSNGSLSILKDKRNELISSDRVLVQNVIGRLRSIWMHMSQKYRWNHEACDMYFKLALRVSSIHELWRPSRAADCGCFVRT